MGLRDTEKVRKALQVGIRKPAKASENSTLNCVLPATGNRHIWQKIAIIGSKAVEYGQENFMGDAFHVDGDVVWYRVV